MPPDPTDEDMLSEIKDMPSDAEPNERASNEPGNVDDLTVSPPTESKPDIVGYNFADDNALMGHKLKYNANGKEVEEDLTTILKRASAGYNYAQLMNDHKIKEQAFTNNQTQVQQDLESAKATNEKWSKFDNFAKTNPDWYNHWENAWANRSQPLDGQPQDSGQSSDRFNHAIDEKLAPINDFMNQQQVTVERQKLADEDRILEQQINGVREKYKDIDFGYSDPETGKTLEYQILEFGQQNGMRDFDQAFKVFYHDNLISRAVEQRKVDAVKGEQTNRRNGVVNVSSSPNGKNNPKAAYDFKGKSYDQAAPDMLNFLNSMQGD